MDKNLLTKIDGIIGKFEKKDEILGAELLLKVESYLQNHVGDDEE